MRAAGSASRAAMSLLVFVGDKALEAVPVNV
jgi:hypothetical protein